MLVSLTEIETTICKAAMGVGLPLGLGEEAGLAARHMITVGIGTIDGFEYALQAVKQKLSVGFNIDNSCTLHFTSKIDGLLLSSIIAGPSACDLASSITTTNKEPAKVTLSRVDVPSVILFVALVTTVDKPRGLRVSWNTRNEKLIEALCWHGSLSLAKGLPEDLLLDGPAEMTLGPIMRKPLSGNINFTPCAQHKIREVNVASWGRIKSYASRLLVGSTESSRLSGAGSGIAIEND